MLKVLASQPPTPRTALRKIAVEFEVPEEVLKTLHGEEGVAKRIHEQFALGLMEEGMISRGRAAEMLGVDAYDLAELVKHNGGPHFTGSANEFARDLGVARSLTTRPAA